MVIVLVREIYRSGIKRVEVCVLVLLNICIGVRITQEMTLLFILKMIVFVYLNKRS